MGRIRDWWAGLQPREQKVLLGGGVVVLGMMLFFFVIHPLVSFSVTTNDQLVSRQDTLERMLDLEKRIVTERTKMEKSARAPLRGRSLLTYVEEAARRTGIYEKVGSIKPGRTVSRDRDQEARVVVALENLVYEDIVKFLFELEEQGTADVWVEKLDMERRRADPKRLNVSMEVAVIQ